MLKNYFIITIRSLIKSKVFVLINVLGMGIALACCVIAYLNFDFNDSYDSQHKNVENVYRINFIREFQGRVTKNGITPMPIVNSIRENMSEAEHIIRYIPSRTNIKVRDDLFSTSLLFTDPEFLDVFTFSFVSGSTDQLKDKGKILINDELAIKYFGDDDPLGKQITHVEGELTKEYIVGGVFEKMPPNSSFKFEAMVNFDNYYEIYNKHDEYSWTEYATVFLDVKDNSKVLSIINQLDKHIPAQNAAREDFKIKNFYLDPFVGMAVRSKNEEVNNHWFNNSLPIPAVIAPVIMSGLLLLIACFNFTNTSIAISSKRLKEIGIRKVMGGMRRHLVLQFLGENILLCLMALIAGLIMAEFLIPAYNQMWDFVSLELNYANNFDFLVFLLVLIVFTGLIAGSYPAFYITKYEPTAILKGTFKLGGSSLLSRILLTFQFMFTLLAVIMGVAFVQNAQYQNNLDMGYDKNGVIYTRLADDKEYRVYRNSLKSDPRIQKMAGTKHQLFSTYYRDPVNYEGLESEVDIFDVGDEYIPTIGMTILAGRGFHKDSETDRKESIIVNEEFVKEFGWKEAIGKRVVWMDSVELFVVGVVKNFYTNGFWKPLRPAIMRYTTPDQYNHLIVSMHQEDVQAVNELMKAKWKELFPNKLYDARHINEWMAESLEVNNNIVAMFIFLGLIATLLSISGLYTLVSLNIIKRTKEIGVRRVLGASVVNVIRIINTEFVIILLIACILGSVASYYLAGSLMASIWAYYLNAGIVSFLIPTLAIFLVSGLVILRKVIKATRENPAYILRDE